MLQAERCWRAVQGRDAAKDGVFFYGVLTTGVFCRPSCPSRLPLRKNVRFYQKPEDAAKDGLRPCLRCHPLAVGSDPNTRRIRDVCRVIEADLDAAHSLTDLAARAGLSPSHFQRSFKAVVGLSPKQYVDALRHAKLRKNLKSAKDVAAAVYDAGYASSSRVYEQADTRLGMTPLQYRKDGEGVTITHVTIETAVGRMMIGATDRGLAFVQFGDTADELLRRLRAEYPRATLEPMREPHHPDFERWVDALRRHLAGVQPHIDLPLDIRSTAFQMRVWSYLRSIPYGEVQSYSEVAQGIGTPSAVRAVAHACASNTVAIAIPCHRVIRSSGELGGYRWGLERKRAIIDRERTAAKGGRA
jgi:AraC family transcriptional regulator, regulatory protein of adaptative response / methylated-DNA-[protein]-cysteine methyltransferase